MPNTPVYKTGELAGSATAVQCPDVAMNMVRFKGIASNAGTVFLGPSSAVTVSDGTTDVTTGWPVDPGETTPWFPCTNLDDFYRISNNAGDDLVYFGVLQS